MSSIFDLHIQVQPQHIDALGHVNNVMYVQWMQDVAAAHIEALGLGLKQYFELKHAMVAVEHHVQYRKAALEGEEIILYNDMFDCIEKMNYYNENEEERERIAHNGMMKVLHNYTQIQVVDKLIEISIFSIGLFETLLFSRAIEASIFKFTS